ncbi:expressed protein, partial [Aureococcus anophagefferens]
ERERRRPRAEERPLRARRAAPARGHGVERRVRSYGPPTLPDSLRSARVGPQRQSFSERPAGRRGRDARRARWRYPPRRSDRHPRPRGDPRHQRVLRQPLPRRRAGHNPKGQPAAQGDGRAHRRHARLGRGSPRGARGGRGEPRRFVLLRARQERRARERRRVGPPPRGRARRLHRDGRVLRARRRGRARRGGRGALPARGRRRLHRGPRVGSAGGARGLRGARAAAAAGVAAQAHARRARRGGAARDPALLAAIGRADAIQGRSTGPRGLGGRGQGRRRGRRRVLHLGAAAPRVRRGFPPDEEAPSLRAPRRVRRQTPRLGALRVHDGPVTGQGRAAVERPRHPPHRPRVLRVRRRPDGRPPEDRHLDRPRPHGRQGDQRARRGPRRRLLSRRRQHVAETRPGQVPVAPRPQRRHVLGGLEERGRLGRAPRRAGARQAEEGVDLFRRAAQARPRDAHARGRIGLLRRRRPGQRTRRRGGQGALPLQRPHLPRRPARGHDDRGAHRLPPRAVGPGQPEHVDLRQPRRDRDDPAERGRAHRRAVPRRRAHVAARRVPPPERLRRGEGHDAHPDVPQGRLRQVRAHVGGRAAPRPLRPRALQRVSDPSRRRRR